MRVYLDHAATTPLDPRVLEAMLPFLKGSFGNPSSLHAEGRKARNAVEECRERVASLIGAEPSEVIFTSGATEANNLAIKGCLGAQPGLRLVTSAAEHEAVLRTAEALAESGREVQVFSPDRAGRVAADQLERALQEKPAGLVSLMYANNEIGSLNPVADLARVAAQHGARMHTDAVQTAGWSGLRVGELGVDYLSLSAHKFYGPKGAGVLYARGGAPLASLLHGGAQERKRRGGTENVAAVAGLAAALELASHEADDRRAHLLGLRARLLRNLEQALGARAVLNTPADPAEAAPHIVNVAFPPMGNVPVDGEMLLLGMDVEGVSVSAGSACTSGALEPSHVLTAIGLDRSTASAAVRFSPGIENTPEHIDFAVEKLVLVLRRMNAL